MAKKKKTQLKPVARGFATTSLPKKIVLGSQPETSSTPENAANDVEQLASNDDGNNTESLITSSAKEDKPVSDDEEKFLQSLVDRLQDKTEKEISRYHLCTSHPKKVRHCLLVLDRTIKVGAIA